MREFERIDHDTFCMSPQHKFNSLRDSRIDISRVEWNDDVTHITPANTSITVDAVEHVVEINCMIGDWLLKLLKTWFKHSIRVEHFGDLQSSCDESMNVNITYLPGNELRYDSISCFKQNIFTLQRWRAHFMYFSLLVERFEYENNTRIHRIAALLIIFVTKPCGVELRYRCTEKNQKV